MVDVALAFDEGEHVHDVYNPFVIQIGSATEVRLTYSQAMNLFHRLGRCLHVYEETPDPDQYGTFSWSASASMREAQLFTYEPRLIIRSGHDHHHPEPEGGDA